MTVFTVLIIIIIIFIYKAPFPGSRMLHNSSTSDYSQVSCWPNEDQYFSTKGPQTYFFDVFFFSTMFKLCDKYNVTECEKKKWAVLLVIFRWSAGRVLKWCFKSWGEMKLICPLKSPLQWFYCLDKEALFWTTHPQFS